MNIKMISAVALATFMGGCATITRGSHEALTVDSEPAGAHVALSTGQTCDATPCVFPQIKRDSELTVTVSKDGYRTWTGAVSHQTSGGGSAGMAGNVLLGGIIGAAIDANNGATQELVPNPLHVALEREPAPAANAAASGAETAQASSVPAPVAQ